MSLKSEMEANKKICIKFERKWCMSNKQTFAIKAIKELLIEEIPNGIVLEPFSYVGTLSKILHTNPGIKVITNDLNTAYNTDYHMDALDFLKQFPDEYASCVVYDPPYSLRQVVECYKGVGINVTQEHTKASWRAKHLDEIKRVLRPNGNVLCFGWNSNGIGKTRGFELYRVLLVAHGGSKNDTICTVERKCA